MNNIRLLNNMNKEYEPATIVDDSDNDNNHDNDLTKTKIGPEKTKKTRTIQQPLNKWHNEDPTIYEIGVDEVGRGPLFGRVYTAAVILPKDDSFDHGKMKDSKKFHSKKKIEEVAEYIKSNALAWYIGYEDEKTIDEINILQATQQSMRKSILEVRAQFNSLMKERTKEQEQKEQKEQDNQQKKEEFKDYNYFLLIDGNYFNPITLMNKKTNKMEQLKHTCIEGGDNKYSAIAAASILAKVERDRYIEELCAQNPTLAEYYGIDSNKGYGAKKHMDGIKEHGITIWHRRSFGICKSF